MGTFFLRHWTSMYIDRGLHEFTHGMANGGQEPWMSFVMTIWGHRSAGPAAVGPRARAQFGGTNVPHLISKDGVLEQSSVTAQHWQALRSSCLKSWACGT